MPDRGKEKRKRILECIKGVDFTTALVGHNRWLVLCWIDGASELSGRGHRQRVTDEPSFRDCLTAKHHRRRVIMPAEGPSFCGTKLRTRRKEENVRTGNQV